MKISEKRLRKVIREAIGEIDPVKHAIDIEPGTKKAAIKGFKQGATWARREYDSESSPFKAERAQQDADWLTEIVALIQNDEFVRARGMFYQLPESTQNWLDHGENELISLAERPTAGGELKIESSRKRKKAPRDPIKRAIDIEPGTEITLPSDQRRARDWDELVSYEVEKVWREHPDTEARQSEGDRYYDHASTVIGMDLKNVQNGRGLRIAFSRNQKIQTYTKSN